MQITLTPYWNNLFQQVHHPQFCLANSLNTPSCHDFWMFGLFTVEAVGMLLIIPVLFREIKKIRGYRSYLKWLAEYEKIADPDVMAKAKWQGDGVALQDVSEKELANKIRQEIAKRHRSSDSQ